MENLNFIISENLKKLREEKRLSLDKVSQMTGVSKSMLGQIERGESNPTIATMWKIANGLKVSFTYFLNQIENDVLIITEKEISAIEECNGKYRAYPFFPYEDERRFEMYKIEVEKGCYLKAEPHGEKTCEFITVFDGELTITVGEDEYTVKAGDSIKFRADKPHSYNNSGNELLRASMVIYYPE